MARVATWNMQGSSASWKWEAGVKSLLTDVESDYVLLQEAGSVPASAQMGASPPGVWDIGGAPANSTMGVWRVGSSTRGTDYYVVHVRCDLWANRNNLAIVSRYPLNSLFQLPPAAGGYRPLIGVTLVAPNRRYMANIHAISGGGWDAPTHLASLQARRAADAALGIAAQWWCGGDFNRNPIWPAGAAPAGSFLWPHRGITHPGSKSVLDYGWGSAAAGAEGVVAEDFAVSDHYPVIYDQVLN